MWTPCIWQGVGVYRIQKTHVYVDPLYLAGCMGIQEIENACLCGPPVSGRVYRVYRRQKTYVYLDPCIWQGVQGIQEIENLCLCGPPVSGRVYRVYRIQKTYVYVDPLYLAGCIGYTGYRKLMFMWTPCIWQGIQGIKEIENSCLCGPPVSGRVYWVYRSQQTHVYVDPLFLAGYIGYTGYRKPMFMGTPCIWQGIYVYRI